MSGANPKQNTHPIKVDGEASSFVAAHNTLPSTLQYYTTRQTAAILGLKPDTVRKKFASGEIRACKSGNGHNGWITFESAIREYVGKPIVISHPPVPNFKLLLQDFREGKIIERLHGDGNMSDSQP